MQSRLGGSGERRRRTNDHERIPQVRARHRLVRRPHSHHDEFASPLSRCLSGLKPVVDCLVVPITSVGELKRSRVRHGNRVRRVECLACRMTDQSVCRDYWMQTGAMSQMKARDESWSMSTVG